MIKRNFMDELFMKRCFQLARLGSGKVSPNPMVGAVLVYNGKVIGEGWHQVYGGAHAEVNALSSVRESDQHLIKLSTLYVSLEPCCVFGNTPPCTNLILENKVPRVVISCLDESPGVAGKGLEILKKGNVEVKAGILESEGRWLVRFRNTYVSKKRPYIILKYALSKDGLFAKQNEQIWLTNSLTKRLVHKWRSEIDAILVGTKTAIVDNPKLTNRLFYGNNPLRIFIDKELKLSSSLYLFDKKVETILVSEKQKEDLKHMDLENLNLPFDDQLLTNLLQSLYDRKITSMIIEGGAFTLQKFIDKNLWDEARILTGSTLIYEGIKKPDLIGKVVINQKIGNDKLTVIQNHTELS